MRRHYYICLVIGALMTGCRTSNLFTSHVQESGVTGPDSIFTAEADYTYRIRKDDKVTISVWNNDDLSVGSSYGIYNSNEVYGKWLMVDANGNIEVPKIGTMHVLGLNFIQLKDSLRSRLSFWVKNPVVDVKILNREITVLGEVRDPQVITVDKERNTLLDMVARCRGFEFYANLSQVKILRQVGTDVHVANIDLTRRGTLTQQNMPLLPGDVVVVPSKKYKTFDKRVSTIIPFTTALSAAAIFLGTL